MFDRYVAVDWSAANTPRRGRDSIWSCAAHAIDFERQAINHPTRAAAEAWLLAHLLGAARAGERVLVGCDFPYGYPAGFARALGVDGWAGVWSYLTEHVCDDARNVSNRFAVAAQINRRLGPRAAFWGRPAHLHHAGLPVRKTVAYRSGAAPDALPEWRGVELALRARRSYPQPAWKLAGAGAAGSQSLVGIPVLNRLRRHAELRHISRVWPFELLTPSLQPGAPAVIHAEIWPSLADFAREPGACRDEQQVRAVVGLWHALDAQERLGCLFDIAPAGRDVRTEEGWVLGVVPRAVFEKRPTRRPTTVPDMCLPPRPGSAVGHALSALAGGPEGPIRVAGAGPRSHPEAVAPPAGRSVVSTVTMPGRRSHEDPGGVRHG